MKLVGDIFKSKEEWFDFIDETVEYHLAYPDHVAIVIENDMGKDEVSKRLKLGQNKEIIESTLASFVYIKDDKLKDIRAGKSSVFNPNQECFIMLYINNIEEDLTEKYDISKIEDIKDDLRNTIIHECRHEQQFFYVVDTLKDREIWNKMLAFDSKNDVDTYFSSILETDAEAYANFHTYDGTKVDLKSFDLHKIISKVLTEMMNSR